jgi:hypothetical protein
MMASTNKSLAQTNKSQKLAKATNKRPTLQLTVSVCAMVHFRTPLTVSYSNFANNLFASSCDNLRPIIAFGTRHLRST